MRGTDDPTGEDAAARALEAALRDPAVRERLARTLAEARPRPWWERYRQFFAGLASGAVVLLAFLVPSVQDQWDRHESRVAIDRYAAIGARLMSDGLYKAADEAYGKALELSEGRRVDLLEAQLRARVARVNEDPDWGARVPEELSESDFVYLLEMQAGPGRERERADTLAALGTYLASAGRGADAEARLREAISLDARNVAAHVALGNLWSDAGRAREAEAEYRRALELSPGDANAVYDLVTLLVAQRRCTEAAALVDRAAVRGAADAASRAQLADCNRAGRP